MNQNSAIGIFDSGFGGLTVMRAIRELLPHENIIYFADTAHLPYGNKHPETILRYTLENTSFLMMLGIKILIIACNTACAAGALDQTQQTYPIPVIGITDHGIEEVIRQFQQGKVGILGTRTTIVSQFYQNKILSQAPSLELIPISCPLFVPLVEEGFIDHPITTLAVQEYLQPLKDAEIQGLLLGCTHYPLLQQALHKELGPRVQLIDPALACAKKTKELLQKIQTLNLSTSSPNYQFFVSDDPQKFQHLGKAFLNFPIELDFVHLYAPPSGLGCFQA